MSENDTIFVGRKPAMNYVLACITCFHGGAEEVIVKARGRAISRAVDVVEIVRRRFLPDMMVKNIDISTEQVPSYEEGGMPVNISSIEIKLSQES
jgi:DNA-binding protein